jgi:hypothetical protein
MRRKLDPMSLILYIVLGVVLIAVGFIIALLAAPFLGIEEKAPRMNNLSGDQIYPEPSKGGHSLDISMRDLQIWFDPHENTLVIGVDGQQYTSISQLSQDQRRYLGQMSADLVAWLGQEEKRPDSTTHYPEAQRTPLPAYPSVTEPKPTPPDRNVVNAFLRSLQPKQSKERLIPQSLAAQVDEILQEKLALSPHARRTIHLMDLPNLGIAVQVDSQQYEGIDAVPDEEIRRLIRESVAEWQRRAATGTN